MDPIRFDFEQTLAGNGRAGYIVGVDEAGRGPLAGPVVAAAACYKDETFEISDEVWKDLRWVRDSKTLSPVRREKAFEILSEYFWLGVGIISSETIDRINILEATFLAMKEALSVLRVELRGSGASRGREDWHVLVDGGLLIPNLSTSQEAVVGGDGIVKSIAAASIAAKVTRDRLLLEYDTKWPEYGFVRHKGYGTREHMRALERYGPLPIHRRSFRPVEQAVIRFRELGIET